MTDKEFLELMREKGLPELAGPILNMRYNMSGEAWYAQTDHGWFFCDARTKKTWQFLPNGPLVG